MTGMDTQDVIRPNTLNAQSSTEIIAQEKIANDANRKHYEDSKLQNITLRQLFADAGAATEITCKLLYKNRAPVSVISVFQDNNVLRGWGFILVLITSVVFLIQKAAE